MKIHQFRYVLFLLALILVGVTPLVYSQDASEQSNDEPSLVEQPSETLNPLESHVNSLEKQITELKHELSALQDSLDNPFQTYAMIFGAIIVLTIVVMFFLSMRKIRQLQNEFENSERGWQNRLNEINQRWEGQLKHIRRQGKDNTEKIEETVSNYSQLHDEQKNFQNALSKLGNRLDGFELTLMNLDLDKVPDETVDEQLQLEGISQETRTQVESLVQTYENGEPIDWIDIEDPTPSQTTLQILNWMARSIEDWEDDLEQSGTANPELIQTLGYGNQVIKDKLKEIRGPAPPVPEPPELETDVNTDAAYNEFQNKCIAYVSRYEGLLIGLQLGCEIEAKEYDQFIPHFVKDRLFNSVARFVKSAQLPEQLDEYLRLVGYEVVPIEIGKTQADARIHEIQSSQQTNDEPGTVVEVILPGLQRIDNGEIIQKPVVIRGE
ncbi:MAG: hypothetical protein OXH00_18465 [Candidatus Poribacteria bacterium]|nr:hypothetical protein [Candidatus Poribacteria bacterium]